jgi:sec-independent protein translocase protein TatC
MKNDVSKQKSSQTTLKDNSEDSDTKSMSILAHLSELRTRLIVSVVAIGLSFVALIFFSTELINILSLPLKKSLPEHNLQLHFTGPLEVFIASLKVAFICAIIFSAPVWIQQGWRFVEPGLYKKERRLIAPFVVASVMFFWLGVGFAYFLILPTALEFLISMGLEVGSALITISDYLSLVGVMLIGFGLVFELPLVLLLLLYLELVSLANLQAARRYVIVACFVLAAVLTPPDPFSQVAMAIPLYLLFELSLLLAKIFITPKKEGSRT